MSNEQGRLTLWTGDSGVVPYGRPFLVAIRDKNWVTVVCATCGTRLAVSDHDDWRSTLDLASRNIAIRPCCTLS